ncbi:MAG: hypothetical protein ACXVBE_02300, partial [Bdellovibrionota bacterium]
TQRLFDVTGEFDLRDGPGHFVIVDAHSPGIAIKNRIEFLVTKRGDVFSTYYHYFGSMLFSHYLAAKTGRESVGRLAGTAAVKFEGKLHRATSGLAREREKRILNDIEGANAGAKLKTAVTNPEKIGTPAENKGIPASYLKPDARIKESYLLEADGRAPIQYGKKEFTRGGMTLEELKLRFQYALEVSKDIFDPVILATSSDGERLQVGLDKYIKSGAKDQELNAMIQKFSSWGGKQRSAADSYDFSLDLNLNNQHLWGEQGTYDLEMSRKRADRLMKLILDMNQLPLLPALPTKSAPEGKCMRLFALIFDGLARPTRGKK